MTKNVLLVLSLIITVSPAALPLTGLNLSNLTTSQGISFYGNVANEQLGSISAGDFNGDNKLDILLGAFQAAPFGKINAGAAYVAFGAINQLTNNNNASYIFIDEIHGYNITGNLAADRTALSVSTAGDFNGDGIEDITLGSHRSDPFGRNNPGTVYIIYGRNNNNTNIGLGIDLSGNNQGVKIFGANNDDQVGVCVRSAGDFNGDGIGDIITAGFLANPSGRSGAGIVYIIFGKRGGYPDIDLATDISNNTIGFKIIGGYEQDNLGMSVGHAGDLNGDGLDDVVVSAYKGDPLGRQDAGIVYVLFGRRSGFTDIDLNTSTINTNSEGFSIFGAQENDNTGISVSAAGDINGDGIDDLIIGANGADSGTGGVDAGVAYVIYGRRSGFTDIDLALDLRNNSLGFNISGANPGDSFGNSVSGLGDVNSDGIDDIVIGANLVDSFGVADSGAAYVIFGKKGQFSDIDFNTTVLSTTQGFRINGVGANDNLGSAVSKAGDINGDGIGDILVAAKQASIFGKASAGAVYLVYGFSTASPDDFSTVATIGAVLNSVSQGSNLAASVISLINFNNPGAICFSSLADGLKYIKYLQINYPPDLKYLIQQPETADNPLSSLISPVEKLKEHIPKYALPEVFERNYLHSSFLINFWSSILTILLILGLIILVYIIEAGVKKYDFLHKAFSRIRLALKWNFFLVAFTASYGDISLFGSLELRSLHFQSFLEFLSFFTCIGIYILMITILIKMILVVRKLRNANHRAQRTKDPTQILMTEEQLKDYQAVFKIFKNSSFISQSFLIIFSIKLFLFYVVVGNLFEYPLFQMIIINIMGISMLLYLAIFRPAKEKIEMIQYFIQELIFQIINSCTLGLAVLDAWDSENPEARKTLGNIIIYSFIAFMIDGLIYMGISLLGIIIEIWKFIRNYLKEKKEDSKTPKKRLSIKLHHTSEFSSSALQNQRSGFGKSDSILQELDDSSSKIINLENTLVTTMPQESLQTQDQSWNATNNTQAGQSPALRYRSRLSSQIKAQNNSQVSFSPALPKQEPYSESNSPSKRTNRDGSSIDTTPKDFSVLNQSWRTASNIQTTENQLPRREENPRVRYRNRLSSHVIDNPDSRSGSAKSLKPNLVKSQKAFNFS